MTFAKFSVLVIYIGILPWFPLFSILSLVNGFCFNVSQFNIKSDKNNPNVETNDIIPNNFWGILSVEKYITKIEVNTTVFPRSVVIIPNLSVNILQIIEGYTEWPKHNNKRINMYKLRKNFDKSVYSINSGLFVFVNNVVIINVPKQVAVDIIDTIAFLPMVAKKWIIRYT